MEPVSAACHNRGKGLEHGPELPRSSTFRNELCVNPLPRLAWHTSGPYQAMVRKVSWSRYPRPPTWPLFGGPTRILVPWPRLSQLRTPLPHAPAPPLHPPPSPPLVPQADSGKELRSLRVDGGASSNDLLMQLQVQRRAGGGAVNAAGRKSGGQ